ncbi:MAG: Rrf2 family transcriptional regulator [Ignavibacteria bacterium]|nr:Rrf2 family transcriptional regulator [Ignavibacteria bacterium]
MNFSKTTEYALRVLVYIGQNDPKIISSFELVEQLQIPKKYLQALLTKLSKNELIRATRGRVGGFVLARPAQEIFLSEIVDAVEGFSATSYCFFGIGECMLVTPCAMHDAWEKLHKQRNTLLQSTRLSDVVFPKAI